MSALMQSDRPGRGRRQIEILSAHPRSAIIDSDCDASIVADANVRAEWQSAMCRGHCQAIEAFPTRRSVPAQAVGSAIDARNLRIRGFAGCEQRRHCKNALRA